MPKDSNGVAGFDFERPDLTAQVSSHLSVEGTMTGEESGCATLNHGLPVMLHSIDSQGRLLLVSDRWLRTLGYSREEVLGRRSVDFLTEESRRHAETVVLPEFFRTGWCENIPYQFVSKNGGVIEVRLSAVLERDAAGKPLRSLAVLLDVTDGSTALQSAREELVARNNDLLTLHRVSSLALSASSPDAGFQEIAQEVRDSTGFPVVIIELFDSERGVTVHKGTCGLSLQLRAGGEAPLEDSPASPLLRSPQPVFESSERALHPWPLAEPQPDIRTFIAAPIIARGKLLGAFTLGHPDCLRNERWTVLATGLANHVASMAERKQAQKKIEHLAYHDTLTGLPNRHLFQDRLTLAIHRAGSSDGHLGVLYLDLDRFKVLNDSLGQGAGDRLLRLVSQRLVESVLPGDTVVRQGGDEFLILLTDMPRVEDISRMARKICGALRHPFRIDGLEVFTSTSIGISVHPLDGSDPETLIKHAGIAMYRAKSLGGDTCRHFTAAMHQRTGARLSLETDLHKALERNELVLHFQPVLDLRTGRISGMEALVRWKHPTRGLLLPGEFIRLAEETGLISPIGLFVLRAACEEARVCRDLFGCRLRVAVNLSLRQIQQPDLVRQIDSAYPPGEPHLSHERIPGLW